MMLGPDRRAGSRDTVSAEASAAPSGTAPEPGEGPSARAVTGLHHRPAACRLAGSVPCGEYQVGVRTPFWMERSRSAGPYRPRSRGRSSTKERRAELAIGLVQHYSQEEKTREQSSKRLHRWVIRGASPKDKPPTRRRRAWERHAAHRACPGP